MSFIEALILGVVQGLTEFLPISSSGHLMLGERFFGIEEPDLFFNVVLHVGTLVAVTLFYREDVVGVISGIWRATREGIAEGSIEAFRRTDEARLGVLLVLGSIPTALIGLTLHGPLAVGGGEDVELVYVIGGLLIVNGFILASAKFVHDSDTDPREGRWTLWNITPNIAVLIGIAQGLAVLPGFSRSGLTIIAALWLGVYRVKAARYSFLLSIPAVGGATLLESTVGQDAAELMTLGGPAEYATYGLAGLIAGIIGYVSILVLVKMLQKAQFWHFSWYCWLVGTGAIGAVWWV